MVWQAIDQKRKLLKGHIGGDRQKTPLAKRDINLICPHRKNRPCKLTG